MLNLSREDHKRYVEDGPNVIADLAREYGVTVEAIAEAAARARAQLAETLKVEAA